MRTPLWTCYPLNLVSASLKKVGAGLEKWELVVWEGLLGAGKDDGT